MPKKVLVAMSGGVDSSAAAALLCQQGCEVVGVLLRLFDAREYGVEKPSRTCCAISDIEDARHAALTLGIPFHVFNYAQLFREQVMHRFRDAYAAGQTPNPCLDCNRYVKFDALLERAEGLGFDAMATGHYAQVEYSEAYGRWVLKKGPDPSKDQSYVLYTLTQRQLSRLLLPCGTYGKDEIRDIAKAAGLPNAHKPDSQDICFVPDGDYAGFLRREYGLDCPPGDFIAEDGTPLGTHRGILHYTVGQRRGLGIPAAEKLYVKAIDAATNTVVLAGAAALLCDGFVVQQPNWVALDGLQAPRQAMVRTRYHQREAPATLYPLPNGCVRVAWHTPQRRPAPGQAAVFYEGDVVLGGGVIANT